MREVKAVPPNQLLANSEFESGSASFEECLKQLGSFYLPEPIFSDKLAAITNDSKVLRKQLYDLDIDSRFEFFQPIHTVLFRGMMLTPVEVVNIFDNGIELSKTRPISMGKICMCDRLNIAITYSFDDLEYALNKENALAVVVIINEKFLADLQRAVSSKKVSFFESGKDIPSEAISHLLVYDANKKGFREIYHC